jgi:hypothetical protein
VAERLLLLQLPPVVQVAGKVVRLDEALVTEVPPPDRSLKFRVPDPDGDRIAIQ